MPCRDTRKRATNANPMAVHRATGEEQQKAGRGVFDRRYHFAIPVTDVPVPAEHELFVDSIRR